MLHNNFSAFNPNEEPIENYLDLIKKVKCVSLFCYVLNNILKNKIVPRKVKDCSFEECNKHLLSCYAPTSRIIAKAFKFHSRRQNNNETLSDFISDLMQLSIKSEFDTFLDRA
ncbi:hypothetical protein PR048_031812 [Dryococelus australis]|uniref:Uncharacterized protein n=1 Tax=Dryococelus australis TaxID=614101 RepID=A0ABQ9G983_9NEOP|nr:hypothetical protein PR048_031812 [Dryococelus australis]